MSAEIDKHPNKAFINVQYNVMATRLVDFPRNEIIQIMKFPLKI